MALPENRRYWAPFLPENIASTSATVTGRLSMAWTADPQVACFSSFS
jgi:hypothetical protein